MATSAEVEFAVQMSCQKCVSSINCALSGAPNVQKFKIDLENGTVVVETTLPSAEVQQLIESTGRKAVLKGYGSGNLGAAVAMLGGTVGYGSVMGVLRFLQVDENECIIEGTVDGLTPGEHGLHIHECGDISKGCESVGEHYNPYGSLHGGPNNNETNRHVGDLGNVIANEQGRATFRLQDKLIKVWDIIGRSVVVTADRDDCGKGSNQQSQIDGNSGTRLTCGIIARSAGIFQNPKKICACSGLTLWDERDKPLIGPGKQPS